MVLAPIPQSKNTITVLTTINENCRVGMKPSVFEFSSYRVLSRRWESSFIPFLFSSHVFCSPPRPNYVLSVSRILWLYELLQEGGRCSDFLIKVPQKNEKWNSGEKITVGYLYTTSRSQGKKKIYDRVFLGVSILSRLTHERSDGIPNLEIQKSLQFHEDCFPLSSHCHC